MLAAQLIRVFGDLSGYYCKSEYYLCMLCRIRLKKNEKHYLYNIEKYSEHSLI
jgi:hypothetical protein